MKTILAELGSSVELIEMFDFTQQMCEYDIHLKLDNETERFIKTGFKKHQTKIKLLD